jgi:tRNA (cmo5U34)-methyltransferase
VVSDTAPYPDNAPMVDGPPSEWRNPEHALGYLARADTFPHRAEGEGVLLDHVPRDARRILDLGTGDGRLLTLLRLDRPDSVGVGLDVSEPMLEAARERFADDRGIELVRHDLAEPLPDLGRFDAVVSCFAIHHLHDTRKRTLYAEAYERLVPGGVFCNLELVASPTPRLHSAFYRALGLPPDFEDPSDQLLDVETQLGWLRDIGFTDVDCYWKWLKMALLIGVK